VGDNRTGAHNGPGVIKQGGSSSWVRGCQSIAGPPVRIDVITVIDGVGFDDAWRDRATASLGGVAVAVLSRHHLIQNKKMAGRKQDLADVEWLESPDGQPPKR
jgi:hypothetical protein